MGHPTVEDAGDDLYVRNIATNIPSTHLQIEDSGWTSEYYTMLWVRNLFP